MSGNTNFDMSAIVSKMIPSNELKSFLAENRGSFTDFGKKNSHILRAKLERLMKDAELPKDAQFMLHFFASLMKRKNRMLAGLEKLEETLSDKEWFEPLQNFVNDYLVDFPDEESQESFALIHLPATNPPLIILCWALSMRKEDVTYDNFLSQQVAAQINLSEEVQSEQKDKMIIFWNETVTKTSRMKNQKEFEKKRAAGRVFDEAIYKNQENDKYLLLGKDFKTVVPADEEVGYTEDEIKAYLLTLSGEEKKTTKKSEEKKKSG
jgi:hypothetical protein